MHLFRGPRPCLVTPDFGEENTHTYLGRLKSTCTWPNSCITWYSGPTCFRWWKKCETNANAPLLGLSALQLAQRQRPTPLIFRLQRFHPRRCLRHPPLPGRGHASGLLQHLCGRAQAVLSRRRLVSSTPSLSLLICGPLLGFEFPRRQRCSPVRWQV